MVAFESWLIRDALETFETWEKFEAMLTWLLSLLTDLVDFSLFTDSAESLLELDSEDGGSWKYSGFKGVKSNSSFLAKL